MHGIKYFIGDIKYSIINKTKYFILLYSFLSAGSRSRKSWVGVVAFFQEESESFYICKIPIVKISTEDTRTNTNLWF